MTLEIHAISTSVACPVSSGDGHLSAEPDNRAWGYNGGKSTFHHGDTCYYLVYRSANVKIGGSHCSSPATQFYKAFEADTELNVVRTGITFTSPVAKVSKPMPLDVVVLDKSIFTCGSAVEYMLDGVTLRVTDWRPSLDIAAPPPYGFMFIEYHPKAEVWALSPLVKNPNLLSTEVHGVLYGIVTASAPTFIGL